MSSHDHPHRHHSHSHDHQQQRVHVNFRLSLPRPTYAHSVCLYGSWDGFTNPLVMEQDRRVSRTLWKGLYTRDGGLRMGGVYEYYFVIDNHRIIPDPASPGDEVMIDEHGRRYSRLQVPVLAPSNPLLSPNESRRGSAASAPAAAPHVVDGNSDHQRRAHARVMSDSTAARNLDFGYVPAGIEPVRRRGSGRGGMKTSAEMEMEQREMEQREMEQRGKREQREMREHRQQREQDARKKLSSLARGTSKLRRMGSKAMMRFVNPQQQSNTTTTSTHDTNPPPLPPPPPPPDTHHDPADTTNASPPKRRRWLGGFTWPRSHPAQDAVYPSSPVPGTTSAASSTATTATRRSSKTPPAGPRPSPLLPPLRVPSSDINDEARHGRCAGSTADGSERMERLHTEGDDVGDIADDMAELFGYLEHAGSEERERVRGAGHNRERDMGALGLGIHHPTQAPAGDTTPELCSSVSTAEDSDGPDPDPNAATHLPPQFGHRDNSNVTDMNESEPTIKPQTRYGNIDELLPPIPGRRVELRELRERVADARGKGGMHEERREGGEGEGGEWEKELAYLGGVVV